MTFKAFALTTTAITFMAGAAIAQDNATDLHQDGTGNDATINQSQGSGNIAGDADGANAELKQTGDYNDLSVRQSGNDNEVGLKTNAWDGTKGVLQNHTGDTSADDPGNLLDITQSSDDNVVGAVSQSSSSTGDFTRNSAVIIQQGAGGHEVGSVQQSKQSSTKPALNVDQRGRANRIEAISQVSGSGGNKTNAMNVLMTGTGNGQIADTLSGDAAVPGVSASTLIQGVDGRTSDGGVMNLTISGNSNQFGATQYGGGKNGNENTLTLNVAGNNNETGSLQDGVSNTISTVLTAGANNNRIGSIQDGIGGNSLDLIINTSSQNDILSNQLGMDNGIIMRVRNGANGNDIDSLQSGDRNALELAVVGGSRNIVWSNQDAADSTIGATVSGNFNDLRFEQFGNDQMAVANISGSGNYLSTMQENGAGAGGNMLDVSISGNNNNDPFTTVSTIDGVSLRSGELIQSGGGNILAMNVSGSNNNFAVTQDGVGNTLTGSQITNGNQMAVLQTGDMNSATITQ